MGEQPIWKITLSDELDPDSVEELLARTRSSQTGGTGLLMERVDVTNGSTAVFVSGARADAQALLARVSEHQPKGARRPKCAACTVEELHRTGRKASPPKRRR